jgi:hypothetical protein
MWNKYFKSLFILMSFWFYERVKLSVYRCLNGHSAASEHCPLCFHKTVTDTDISLLSATLHFNEKYYVNFYMAQLKYSTGAVFSHTFT